MRRGDYTQEIIWKGGDGEKGGVAFKRGDLRPLRKPCLGDVSKLFAALAGLYCFVLFERYSH